LDNFNKEMLVNTGVSTSQQRLEMDNVVFRYKMGYNVSISVSYKF